MVYYPADPFPVITSNGQSIHRDDENDVYWKGELLNESSGIHGFMAINQPEQYNLGSYPLMNSSIFSFYPPDFSKVPASTRGLNVPSLASTPPTIISKTSISFQSMTIYNTPNAGGNSGGAWYLGILDWEPAFGDTYSNTGSGPMIQRANLMMCGGRLSTEKFNAIRDFLNEIDISGSSPKMERRASICVQIVSRCSEFYVTF